MKANSDKSKQSKKATRRVLAGVLCGASVLSLVLSLVMPPISQAIANDAEAGAAEKTVAAADSSTEFTDVDNTTNGDAENQDSSDAEGGEGEDAAAADLSADDTEADGAAQPADDGEPVYKVATIANEGEAQGLQKDTDDYTLLKRDDDLSTYLDMGRISPKSCVLRLILVRVHQSPSAKTPRSTLRVTNFITALATTTRSLR